MLSIQDAIGKKEADSNVVKSPPTPPKNKNRPGFEVKQRLACGEMSMSSGRRRAQKLELEMGVCVSEVLRDHGGRLYAARVWRCVGGLFSLSHSKLATNQRQTGFI